MADERTGIKYIGKEPYYKDRIFGTGLVWKSGEALPLAVEVAKEFLKHPTLFQEVKGLTPLMASTTLSGEITIFAGEQDVTGQIGDGGGSNGTISLTSFRRAGQSDWTLAWQDALNESVATGKSIYVPPSMDPYYIAAPGIINGDGVSIKGHSYLYSRLSGVTPDVAIVEAYGHDNLVFEDLDFGGLWTNFATFGDQTGLQIGNSQHGAIRRCRFHNFAGAGLRLEGYDYRDGGVTLPKGVWDYDIEGNRFVDCFQGYMAFNDARRLRLVGNRAEHCITGIFHDDSHVIGGTEVARPVLEIMMLGNYAVDCRTSGFAFAGVQDSTIIGCHAIRSGRWEDPATNYGSGFILQNVQNGIPCERNTFIGISAQECSAYGLSLTGSSYNQFIGLRMVNNSRGRTSGGTPQVYVASTTYTPGGGVSTTYPSSYNLFDIAVMTDDAISTVGSHVQIMDANCVGNRVRGLSGFGGGSANKVLDAGTGTVVENNGDFIFGGATFGSGVTAVEAGDGNGPHRTTIKLTNVTLSLYDQGTTANGGIKFYTLPAGAIALQGATINLTTTTTGLADGYALDCAIGTISSTSADGVLTGNEANIVPAISAAFASNSIAHKGFAGATGPHDGTTTAVPLYLNFASASDAGAARTLTVSGTIVLHWTNLGDY